MAKKRVLVVGSGGREHALSWKLSQSPEIGDLFVAPGNGGTLQVADNVNIQATDIQGLLRFAKDQRVDLTVIGPEDPLVAGIADVFRQQGLRVFGPSAQAAELESSKAFAKRLMANHLIQTAPFEIFDDYQTAVNYLNECCFAPVVVKASGLALGKGAYPCHTLDQAQTVLEDIMVNGIHQEAGKVVIIEKFLHGQEASIHALSNGIDALMLPASQDHKAAFDNDTGPNTGGMGCFAPIPWYNAEYLAHAKSAIVFPVLRAMGQKATPWSTAFIGCLYPGLMVQGETDQSVLEFNVRFGDPETQALMRLLKGDLFPILEACSLGEPLPAHLDLNPGFAVCVVMASKGYPGPYDKGIRIEGIEDAQSIEGIEVFHAGTKIEDGKPITSGGRVLGVTGIGQTLAEAIANTYNAVIRINPEGLFFRTDIGAKDLKSL